MTLPASPLFVGSAFRMASGVVLFALLCVASAFDIRTRKIPNWLVVLVAVLGLGFSYATAPGFHGLVAGILALLVGLAIWLPSWLFRWLGAGDVKLFAAASAWLGVRGALEAAIFGALCGGILAFVWIFRYRGGALRMLNRHAARTDRPAASALPYTVALAAGTEIAAWFPHLLFR